MNELIFMLLFITVLIVIYAFEKLFEKNGLLYILIILNMLSFIMSFKISNVFNSNINTNIIPIIGLCTIIYLYLIKNGKKEFSEVIKISLYSNITISLFFVLLNSFIPTITDNFSINIQEMCKNYLILIFFPIIVLVSEFIIYKLYELLYKIKTNNILIVILTYIISSIVFTIISNVIFNINILKIKESLFLGLSTYILGLILTLISALYIFILTKKKVKK